VAEEAFEQTAFEDFVQEKVAEGRSIRQGRRRARSSSAGARPTAAERRRRSRGTPRLHNARRT
jgi:hypothetical protein